MKVWTKAYRPFIMGGNVNADVVADIQLNGQINVGGTGLVMIQAPNGDLIWVCATTGGLLGEDLDSIRKDLAESNALVLAQQMIDMKDRGEKADPVTTEEFWKLLGKTA